MIATRYFDSAVKVIESIALEIENRELRDFGAFLKGNDYEGNDTITNSDFF